MDRKTARRYVEPAVAAGLVRDGGEGQLSDELLGAVVAAVRPARRSGHGQAWERCWSRSAGSGDSIERDELVLTNTGKLARLGVVVPYRTMHRFALGFEVSSPRISVNEQRVRDAATRKRLHEFFRSLPGDRFPTLIAIGEHVWLDNRDERFAAGINALVDGLEQTQRPASPPS